MLSCQGALTCEIEASKTLAGLVPRRQDRHRLRSSVDDVRHARNSAGVRKQAHGRQEAPRSRAAGRWCSRGVVDSRHECRLGMRRPEPRGWAPLTSVNRSGDRTGSRKRSGCCVLGSDDDGLWGRAMLRMSGGSRLRSSSSRESVCARSPRAAGSSVPLDPLSTVLLERRKGPGTPGSSPRLRLTKWAAVVCRAAVKAPS